MEDHLHAKVTPEVGEGDRVNDRYVHTLPHLICLIRFTIICCKYDTAYENCLITFNWQNEKSGKLRSLTNQAGMCFKCVVRNYSPISLAT